MAHPHPEAQLPPRDGGVEPSDETTSHSTRSSKNAGQVAGYGAGGSASQLLPQTAGSASNVSQLRISEIFFSLQGETSRVGLPTVFVRLTGCPLRCTYCDTTYAFTGGRNMSVAEILRQVAGSAPRYVTVTGGEPLAQRNCLPLLSALCDAGYEVSLETGGALDIGEVDQRVMRVVDIKTPASGEVEKNRWENLPLLHSRDEIKFVLCDENDYLWACGILRQHHLPERCGVLFSPAHGMLNPTQLADWILRDRLPVRMQLQLHKLLWDNAPGH
ncbi:MAG: 7-carboxy-7-deazaguanine synthase QueE [Nitrosomonadales bacterium]|nr:7-carboxy-7-deazaguanine synthase QueE [Nitrosomonadales bacterium]